MPDRGSAIQDRAAAVEPPIVCTQPDDVAEVRALDGFRLFVRFFDGTEGVVDMNERVLSKRGGVFNSLADPKLFAEVSIQYGAVTWSNGLDIAPDATYDDFKRYGAQILR